MLYVSPAAVSENGECNTSFEGYLSNRACVDATVRLQSLITFPSAQFVDFFRDGIINAISQSELSAWPK